MDVDKSNIGMHTDVVSVNIMHSTGHPYKQTSVEDNYDVIVIGSGIGGLTTAALLARHAAKKVLVLERHYTAGGFTHVFRRPGYEWDVGVHYIGGVQPGGPVRAAFDSITEGRLDWQAMPDVYDRIHIADRAYDFPSGVERFRDRMKQYFPREARAIDRYLAAVFAAVRASGLYFAEKAIPRPLARLIGGMMRSRFLRYAGRTTAQVLSELTKDRELIGVLTGQWGDYGLPPSRSSFGMHALVAHHYLEGAGYPVGGASEIAAGIAPIIEAQGGQIVVAAEVAEIVVQRDRAIGVKMADGRVFHAPTIVSDAGARNTFARLLPPSVGQRSSTVEEVNSIAPSMAHLCLYIGLRRAPGDPEPGATNLWICPGADHDINVARFVDQRSDFPAVFISFPSAKDPTFGQRYPGRSTIEVVAPAPYEWFGRWADSKWKHRRADYDALKQDLSARLLDALYQHVPAARGRVDYTELSTPLSTRHFANFEHGEVYGLEATPARFHLRHLGAHTRIRGLYLTGADVSTAGVTGALAGGAIAASAILGRNLVSSLFRRGAPRPKTGRASQAAA